MPLDRKTIINTVWTTRIRQNGMISLDFMDLALFMELTSICQIFKLVLRILVPLFKDLSGVKLCNRIFQ